MTVKGNQTQAQRRCNRANLEIVQRQHLGCPGIVFDRHDTFVDKNRTNVAALRRTLRQRRQHVDFRDRVGGLQQIVGPFGGHALLTGRGAGYRVAGDGG